MGATSSGAHEPSTLALRAAGTLLLRRRRLARSRPYQRLVLRLHLELNRDEGVASGVRPKLRRE